MSDVPLADMTASFVEVGSAPSTEVSFMTAAEHESSIGHSEDRHGDYRHHDELDTDLSRVSSRASLHDSQSSEHLEYPRHVSPPPPDEHAQNIRDERRYRMLLQHEFHPSRAYYLYSSLPARKLTSHSSNPSIVDAIADCDWRGRLPQQSDIW